jgi:hypothetical protein
MTWVAPSPDDGPHTSLAGTLIGQFRTSAADQRWSSKTTVPGLAGVFHQRHRKTFCVSMRA